MRSPRWLGAVNRALMVLPLSGGPEAIFERLAHDAARRVGGSLPVDPDVQDGLTLVLADILAEPRMTRLGVLSGAMEVRRRLVIALALRRIEHERPEIVESPLAAPLVVLGLPRSGTTAMQEALAAQPGLRTTRFWELVSPPSVGRGSLGELRAIARSAAFSTFAHLAMPALRRLHPLGATTAQETTQALANSLHHAVRAPLPSYRSWLASRDPTPDLDRLRILLRVLGWDPEKGGPSEQRWVLKSPFHLHDAGALLGVFPGARLIWTHRDPAAALGSWCQLVETVQSMAMHRRDQREIGAEWLASWAEGMRSAREALASNPESFVDVDQADLAGDAAAVVSEVLSRTGASPTGSSSVPGRPRRSSAGAGSVPNPLKGRSSAKILARYGLDPDEVRHRLSRSETGPQERSG